MTHDDGSIGTQTAVPPAASPRRPLVGADGLTGMWVHLPTDDDWM
jgi:hypothetical protein